jgi:hypothetical protein
MSGQAGMDKAKLAAVRSQILLPGEPAPMAGRYAEYDVFGGFTGFVVTAAEGAPLPSSPLNFTWKLTPSSPTLRFRVRRRPAAYAPRATGA